MKFQVLALDYDGTIANEGRLDTDVRFAIDLVRARGLAVLLVTGRILRDLHRVAGSLDFVDAVIAENGAVLAFPNGGRSILLAPPPSPLFLKELARRGIHVEVGECVVEAEASLARSILAVIRDLELPLTLLFNRSRLMVLPQGISKATGLHAALRALRLSAHNTLAIGDAENDHALLMAAEHGVAVEWGSKRLKQAADEVLVGQGPYDVADYIRERTRLPLLPHRVVRRHVHLGQQAEGRTLDLALRGRNVLIAGDPLSGKSWVAGLLAEQLILQQYNVCVIDPEGDYTPLERLPGVLVLGEEGLPPCPHEILRFLSYPDLSLVIDLSRLPHEQKIVQARDLLALLKRHRRQSGLPHRIVVDEAHYFLQGPDLAELFDLELSAYTLITYRLSELPSAVLQADTVRIVTRLTDPAEIRTLAELSGRATETAAWNRVLSTLPLEEAALLPGIPEAQGELRPFRIAPRLTSHVRHRHKYLEVPVPARQAFVFTEQGRPTGQRAHTLEELVTLLANVPLAQLDAHLRASDFSRWMADVFHDHALAQALWEIEAHYRRTADSLAPATLVQLIQERYAEPYAMLGFP